MKTALILGISGNFGQEMAKALSNRGWSIRAIVRKQGGQFTKWPNVEVIEGDYQDRNLLASVSDGVELLVYAINPPYTMWRKHALNMLEPVVELAEKKQIHLLFPGNVYNLNPTSDLLSENTPLMGVTAKGELRKQMEQRLKRASESGARISIVRAGDFIGQHSQWLEMILKNKQQGCFSFCLPHDSKHRHYWSYLPDLCANTAAIIEQSSSQFEVWHDPGLVVSQKDWLDAFEHNGLRLNITSFPWWFYSLLAVFVPLVKEVMEMKYLWEKELILDGSKMKKALGQNLQSTELKNIVHHLTK